jgi:hypothetical protein
MMLSDKCLFGVLRCSHQGDGTVSYKDIDSIDAAKVQKIYTYTHF